MNSEIFRQLSREVITMSAAKTANRPTPAPAARTTPPTPAANPTAGATPTATPAAAATPAATEAAKRDKAASFQKLANKRVPKVLAALEQVKAISNRRSYSYTEEQAKKINDAIAAKVKEVTDAFASDGTASGGGFS